MTRQHNHAAPRGLQRKDGAPAGLMRKEVAFKADSVKEDGTFSGYGSVFGNIDSYGEIVAKGAFTKSLAAWKKSGRPVPALWQHRSGEPIGGFLKLSEDDYGLKFDDAFLVLEDPTAKRAYLYMQKGIITGMSIGYYVRKSSYDEKTGIRTLTELDLVEISVVTFPANEAAQIGDVKSQLATGKMTVRQVEEILRDAGFSKSLSVEMAGVYGKSRRDSEGKASVLDVLRSSNPFN